MVKGENPTTPGQQAAGSTPVAAAPGAAATATRSPHAERSHHGSPVEQRAHHQGQKRDRGECRQTHQRTRCSAGAGADRSQDRTGDVHFFKELGIQWGMNAMGSGFGGTPMGISGGQTTTSSTSSSGTGTTVTSTPTVGNVGVRNRPQAVPSFPIPSTSRPLTWHRAAVGLWDCIWAG